MSTGKSTLLLCVVALLAIPMAISAQDGQGDPDILATMEQINAELDALGMGYRIAEVELYTTGWGQPTNRVLIDGCRWVPYDPYRFAQDDDITYLVVQSLGDTASGLSNAQTEAAIDRAMATWNSQQSLAKVDVVKRPDPGTDVTIFDYWIGYGSEGYPYAADIVHAGWYPAAFFDLLEPGGGENILGVSVTFIWVDTMGLPADINGDNYLDTALVEIYYNDYFGESGGTREGNPWGIDIELPGMDIETVALHEAGHALGLGHFGPPPDAVMNPYYAGIDQDPSAVDNAGMSALWRSWPNR